MFRNILLQVKFLHKKRKGLQKKLESNDELNMNITLSAKITAQ